MANVTITQLPTAGAITGDELVPIVQNGVTVQTTTGAIAASPSQTQTFLTLNQEPTLPNSRRLAGGTGVGLTDGGAQSTLQIVLNGASGSLEVAGNGIVAKTASNAVTARSLVVDGAGLEVVDGDGVAGNPTFALTGVAAAVANLSGTGLMAVRNGSTVGGVQILGTANQISVANGNGNGNPTLAIVDNATLPGAEGIVLPIGNTSERGGSPSNGTLRYNSQTGTFEGFANNVWGSITTGSGVTSIETGLGLTGGPITSTGTISVDTDVVVTWSGSQTLTNKVISGSDNSLTNIGNASLTNSSITINGSSVSLGGSVTVTATASQALTIGTGLSGTSYNGSTAVTVAIANTGVTGGTYGSASVVPVFAVNAQGQITSVTNTSISIPSSALTDKGLAGGVATLDGGGTVPLSQLPASILGALSYQGTWNASTNSPALASGVGTKGYYYVVNVAGSTNLDGITDWLVGDWAVFNGTAWQKVDNTESVTSVNGYTGTVVLSYTDVGAPSTSGTNATGTWGISISGNASTATTSTNLAGGLAGSMPYQSGVGATSLLAIGLSSYIMTSSGTAPQWSAPSGLTVGTATNAVNVGVTATSSNSDFYIPLITGSSSANYPLQVASGPTINPSTGKITAGISGGSF